MDLLGLPSAVWLPIVTLILGASLKAIFDLLTERRLDRRERDARRENRIDAARERRIEFQRSTLLDLQDVLHAVSRATVQAYLEDMRAAQAGTAWGKHQINAELDAKALEAEARWSRLIVRVWDAEIQGEGRKFRSLVNSYSSVADEKAAHELMARLAVLNTDLNERIGAALRQIDEAEERLSVQG